jgi:hypothetical protein
MSNTKPFCKAPWINLNYSGTLGIAPCCEWLDKKNDTKCDQAIAIINTHDYDEMAFKEFI